MFRISRSQGRMNMINRVDYPEDRAISTTFKQTVITYEHKSDIPKWKTRIVVGWNIVISVVQEIFRSSQ